MANKIFNYRYRASALAGSYGLGNFNVSDVASYNSIMSLVDTSAGSEQRFTYSLSLASSTVVWEYGIGYITNLGGGNYQFVRESSLSSSEADNSKVNILNTYGVVYIDVVSPNPNFTNYKRINSNTTLANVNSTYFIDATGNLTLSLPSIATDSTIIGLTITSLSGSENERPNAVTLDASGANTINGSGTYTIIKKNDFVRIISDIENSNWIVLDPIADTISASGPNGAIQLSDNGVLGYNNGFFFNNDSLFVGGGDAASAVVQIGGELQNTIFNIQSGNIDFTINTNGIGNTFFVDASANSIGINTNTPTDLLNISTTGIEGITISTSTSGSIPKISFINNDPNFTEGLDIGRIDFIGTNNSGENITYSRIISEATDTTYSSEEGELKFLVNNNGTLQTVGLLTYEDIQIGPDNSISGGIIIGSNSTNKGDNICIGNYNTNCGVTSINIGHQNTIESGSYAGAVGSYHTITGSHLWLFGGSGADITGNNSTYLLTNDNNYILLKHDQKERIGFYVDSTGTELSLKNTRISSTGTIHSNNIVFRNNSGVFVTGVSYGITVLNPAQSAEDTRFFINTLDSGILSEIFSISSNNINISNLSGIDNSIYLGRNLSVSGDGANIIVVGLSNIISNNSGINTVIGYNNELTTSGNDHVVVIGNSNTADENYTTTVGTSNQNSGLYSAIVGYNNGVYGENIGVVGVNNSVSGNNSSVVGYQNQLNNNSIYVIGQGNISNYSGVNIIGNDITATGHNTSYIKNNTVVITGNYITIDTTGNINVAVRPILEGSGNMTVSGDNISVFVNDINYVTSGDNVSELVNDTGYITGQANVTGINYTPGISSGILILSHHSGTVTGILNDIVHTGQNISIFVNDVGYLTDESYVTGISYSPGISSGILVLSHHSGTTTGILNGIVHTGQNISVLTNNAGYITSDDFAKPKLTFDVSATGDNTFIFSGAGTDGVGNDENPTLYLYKGFNYDFDINVSSSHALEIKLGSSLYTSGLTNNTGVNSGIVSWSVRHDTVNSGIYYICSNHAAMSGDIRIV